MPIYLDHAATTPLRREVVDAMLPYLTEHFGNPSSAHAYGRTARAALDEAHERLAARLNADPRELVSRRAAPRRTTSRSRAPRGPARRAVTASSPARRAPRGAATALRYLEKFGFEIVELPVDRYGRVDPDDVERALTDRRSSSRSCSRNNEVGTHAARRGDREAGRDAARACFSTSTPSRRRRTAELDVEALGCGPGRGSAAHKFEGPRASAPCGSGRGRVSSRSSMAAPGAPSPGRTEDVAGAVGLSVAYDLTCAERPGDDHAAPVPAREAPARDAGGRSRGADRPSHGAAAGPVVGRRP